MNVTWNACFAAGLPANVFAQTVGPAVRIWTNGDTRDFRLSSWLL